MAHSSADTGRFPGDTSFVAEVCKTAIDQFESKRSVGIHACVSHVDVTHTGVGDGVGDGERVGRPNEISADVPLVHNGTGRIGTLGEPPIPDP